MGSMYFDTRLGGENKNSQLRQLYHQEGIRAITASIRRGFEELYDARKALIESAEGDFTFTPFETSSSIEKWSVKAKSIPRISFRKRLQSFSNFQVISQLRDQQEKNADIENNGDLRARNRRSNSLFVMNDPSLHVYDEKEEGGNGEVRKRSLSDLEPVLKKVTDLANRLMKTQNRTTLEFLSSYSSLDLEFRMCDMRREEEEEDSRKNHPEPSSKITTDQVGLLISNILTFLYLANQYVVAPSSAEYAQRLGMSQAMSGMIIGLTPAAALVSSLIYSMWSNHSFKQPLLVSILCGVAGNLLYGLALQCNSPTLILAGRLVTGFGGPRVVSRRYIADHVAFEDRLMASSQFVTAGALGLAFGPLIASIIEIVGLHFELKSFDGSFVLVQYEKVTAPGWIMACAWMFTFALVLVFFREPVIRVRKPVPEEEKGLLSNQGSSKQVSNKQVGYGSTKQNVVFVETGSELWTADTSDQSDLKKEPSVICRQSNNSSPFPAAPAEELAKRKSAFYSEPHSTENSVRLPPPTPMYKDVSHGHDESLYKEMHDIHQLNRLLREREKDRGSSCWDHISVEVQTILFLYVVNKTGQELTVSSMPLLLKQLFLWPSQSVGYYMAVIGVLVLPTNVIVNSVAKDVEERDMVVRLSYLSLAGVLFMLHLTFFGEYSLGQYVIGTAVIFTSLNALEGVIMSLLARLLSPELAKGTFNSGLLATEAGTFGRVVGDMAITAVGESFAASALPNHLFIPLGAVILFGILIVNRIYDKLID
eukprot:scaffold5788_cov159-Ochromonas_danica.AAC.4